METVQIPQRCPVVIAGSYIGKKIKPDILHAHYIGIPAYLGIASRFHPLVLTASLRIAFL